MHTNGELRFVGRPRRPCSAARHTPGRSATARTARFVPLPAPAPESSSYPLDLTDRRLQTRAGRSPTRSESAYHDMTARLRGRQLARGAGRPASGVYYAPCPIQLNGSDIGGRVTLVSEARSRSVVRGRRSSPTSTGCCCSPARRGTKAIDVATPLEVPRRDRSPARGDQHLRRRATASTAGSWATGSTSPAATPTSGAPSAGGPTDRLRSVLVPDLTAGSRSTATRCCRRRRSATT